ncbi:unnamed protein product, partial [Mesorhabditis spiculigera]
MIWWNLKLVGCGGTLCDGGTRVIFVCRYSETGLIIGNNSYPTGPLCSGCGRAPKVDAIRELCSRCADDMKNNY